MRSIAFQVAGLVLLASPLLAYNPAAGDFIREQKSDLRIMSYNLERRFPPDAPEATTAATAALGRVLNTMKPDVIFLNEVYAGSSFTQIAAGLTTVYPPPAGTTWNVQISGTDTFIQSVVASPYPMTLRRTDTLPASEVRGAAICLITLPDKFSVRSLYCLAFHLKASGGTDNEARRQKAADAIISWLSDARTPGGNVNLPAGTPFVYGGDTNLNATSGRTELTLTTGDINDEATWGADSPPDWDNTAAFDVSPKDPINNSALTWSSTSQSVRFDRFFVSDSKLAVPHSFILNTFRLSAPALAAAGLQSADSRTISDHLSIVADLRGYSDMWLMY